MLNENGVITFLFSFLFVALIHALLASFTTIYYKKKPLGHLSHSQLRIKQGNATFEHRLNVFAQSFVFCFVTLRFYFISLVLWLIISGGYHVSTLTLK
ncbi:MAG: hypothetical protein WBB19_14590 [Desulforhopalus sp.]